MRARNNARPAVVDASVAPSTAAPPAPVAPKPDAALVDRIAELELALEARDATIAELTLSLANAHASYEAEIASLKALVPVASSADGVFKRRVVGPCGIRFRGREYVEGDVFPFDPADPPHDVSGNYVEGYHYRYE